MASDDSDRMGSVSLLLARVRQQDEAAKRELFAVLYDELRRIAADVLRGERPGNSLQATDLAHEAVIRLLAPQALANAENRRYLFHAACQAMRRILVDHARRRSADKRGGGRRRHDLDLVLDEFDGRSGGDFAAFDEQLQDLEAQHPRLARVVECRFLGGMSVQEIAALLDVSEKTVHRDWRLAKAILKRALLD